MCQRTRVTPAHVTAVTYKPDNYTLRPSYPVARSARALLYTQFAQQLKLSLDPYPEEKLHGSRHDIGVKGSRGAVCRQEGSTILAICESVTQQIPCAEHRAMAQGAGHVSTT
jgi:hypothetical protein